MEYIVPNLGTVTLVPSTVHALGFVVTLSGFFGGHVVRSESAPHGWYFLRPREGQPYRSLLNTYSNEKQAAYALLSGEK